MRVSSGIDGMTLRTPKNVRFAQYYSNPSSIRRVLPKDVNSYTPITNNHITIEQLHHHSTPGSLSLNKKTVNSNLALDQIQNIEFDGTLQFKVVSRIDLKKAKQSYDQNRSSDNSVLKIVLRLKTLIILEKTKLLGLFMMGAAALLLIVGTATVIQLRNSVNKVRAASAQTTTVSTGTSNVTDSVVEPDVDLTKLGENKPVAANYNSSVDPNSPYIIKIPSINAEAHIKTVGVTKSGAMNVPGNVLVAGWFSKSAKFDEPGLSIIDGHVSGPTVKGSFYNLKKIKTGDSITIQMGSGKVYSFHALETKQVSAAAADSQLYKWSNQSKHALNLITCGGHFNSSTDSYDDRIIVYAQQD